MGTGCQNGVVVCAFSCAEYFFPSHFDWNMALERLSCSIVDSWLYCLYIVYDAEIPCFYEKNRCSPIRQKNREGERLQNDLASCNSAFQLDVQ